ncbi:MAG: type II toxin-antitoxin system RelE/ParE family toxin [Gammaproteobacteria bacterium]
MTTPYHIKISPTAEEQILTLAGKYQKNILKVLEALAINPRPPGVKKIEGMMGLYSEQINHLRLVYKVEDQEILLLLIK